MQQAAFFGGAITASIPQRFIDVSPFREVPDNQEVWVDANTDQSIIIELLAYEPTLDDASALEFHWNELSQSNDATGLNAVVVSTQVLPAESIPGVAGASLCALLRGQQSISKFKEAARNIVGVDLALIRLPQHETDILISMNTPAAINQGSSSAAVVTNSTTPVENASVFQTLVGSFTIRDYTLFNG